MPTVQPVAIVTVDQDHKCVLSTPAQKVDLSSPKEKKETAHLIETLLATLKPRLPAAGLAAPQIGVSKRVFIFSWDRSETYLKGAINPSFEPIGDEKETRWEACFSCILGQPPFQIAYVPRYKKIQATYIDEAGKKIQQILSDFGARVFQHECDHLDGMENIRRADAKVKTFASLQDLNAFMSEVKKGDVVQYTPPTAIFND